MTDLNQNIIEITKIRQSKEAKLTNELLDTTFNDIYDMFIDYEKKENKNKFIKYGKKCNTIKEFLLLEKKKKGNDKKYIDELGYWAINIFKYFDKNKSRRSNKKENKFIGTNFEVKA